LKALQDFTRQRQGPTHGSEPRDTDGLLMSARPPQESTYDSR
jgi:hypothetical protein